VKVLEILEFPIVEYIFQRNARTVSPASGHFPEISPNFCPTPSGWLASTGKFLQKYYKDYHNRVVLYRKISKCKLLHPKIHFRKRGGTRGPGGPREAREAQRI
jgi:hypothetical protein